MTIDYDAIAQEASAAIAEAGFIAILRKETGGPSAPWDEGTTTVTDSEVTVIDSGIRDRYIAGTLITRKTRTLIVGKQKALQQIYRLRDDRARSLNRVRRCARLKLNATNFN